LEIEYQSIKNFVIKNNHKKSILLSLLTIFYLSVLSGQLYSQNIFPGLYGQELIDSLVSRYKTSSTLSYNEARDKMYALIDNHNDSVTCVYTGYTIYVPYNSPNPRTYTNAANPIINAEHTWPRSKGAVGIAESDLHHIFPTNAVANSARDSLPFSDIPDLQTDRWYRKTQVLYQIPSQFIDEYSELELDFVPDRSFEPREDHKGNVARAMFYFYTMYRTKADSTDPTFFERQKQTLRYWNSYDPVDAAEIQRTELIATYQNGKVNPFVLDTTLIGRAHFGVTTIAPGNLSKSIAKDFILISNYPNPFNNSTVISVDFPRTGHMQTEIYNLSGQLVEKLPSETVNAGNYKIYLNCDSWASGVYLVEVQFEHYRQVHKMILLR